jgi:hypothetical protein
MAPISRPAKPDREKDLDDLREKSLDETIESTFPASDPASTIPDPIPDVEHTGERKEPLGLDF